MPSRGMRRGGVPLCFRSLRSHQPRSQPMSTEQSASPPTVTSDVERYDRHLSIALGDEDARFHYVWLRDNCGCRAAGSPSPSANGACSPPTIRDDIAPVDAWWSATPFLESSGTTVTPPASRCLAARAPTTRTRRCRHRRTVIWDATLGVCPFVRARRRGGPTTKANAYLDAVRDYGAGDRHKHPAGRW